MQFREFVDHLGGQVRLDHPRGLFRHIGIGTHGRRDLAGQCGDPVNALGLRAQFVVEGDLLQRLGECGHAFGLQRAQIVLPEELGIGQSGCEHLLVARQNGRALIGGLGIGDGDETLDPAVLAAH